MIVVDLVGFQCGVLCTACCRSNQPQHGPMDPRDQRRKANHRGEPAVRNHESRSRQTAENEDAPEDDDEVGAAHPWDLLTSDTNC